MKAMYLREEKIKRRTTIQSLKGENGQFIKLHVIKDEIRKDSTKKGVLASWEGMADWTSMMAVHVLCSPEDVGLGAWKLDTMRWDRRAFPYSNRSVTQCSDFHI